MKVHIIFDGKERHEYVTNEFDETNIQPSKQPHAVAEMLSIFEHMVSPMIVASEPKPQTPAQ